MTLQRALWLLLVPLLAGALESRGETTPDYNIYDRDNAETTPDYNIYYERRQVGSGPNFMLTDDRARQKPDIVVLPKPFEETNPERVEAGELFDKDILLTEAQKRAMVLRKGLASESYRWPEAGDGFPRVPYRFADGEVDQEAVNAGIAHWEQHTCIRFELTTNVNQPHIKFQKLTGCWSYIGYIASFTTGQDISIGSGCTSLGTVAHEIGHAMGFYHEQSRPDRDTHVHINEENIWDGREGNFDKQTDSRVDSKGIAYDYTSDMHYSGFGFSKNGRLTIATVDPRNQELIGRRAGLSHRDKHLANLMYGCIGKWMTKCGVSSDPCKNGGYLGSSCACVCPAGTSGSSCETLELDYFASQRGDCSIKITSPTTITSPNYPNNYPYGLNCAKWIVAPECKLPKVTFSAFTLPSCSYDWDKLEIRTSNRFDGDFYCGTDIAPGTSFTSSTNELILMFYTRSNSESGWSADVTFVDAPGCNTATTTPPSSSSCSLVSATEGVSWFSPNFGSENYPNNFQCGLKGSSASPYTSTFALNTFQLQGKKQGKCVDFVEIQIPYNRTVKLCGNRKGSIVVPNMNLNVNFVTDAWKTNVGFDIGITWRQTNCHRVIELTEDNASGIIRSPRYPKNYPWNAVCEWWIVAPEGKKIQLEFTTISMRDRKCTNSYIAVDKSGSAKYFPENSSLFCAADRSASVTSDGNRVNVAFAGGWMRSKGFSARYTLV
ncbi:blastula protease 10-like isoform X2 [Penaeus japonicus]|uniref:blastula protease 10-like isoform X1 n=1 Tax=Penaeus japonicus TaxID=27405 RepID=UPI001C71200F|nr:blastula protease 10-like isoform X1 [Penaeus japonicus]XP_042887923.1 blastula protease 10-like isoform X2 [Penaeus japonicus]